MAARGPSNKHPISEGIRDRPIGRRRNGSCHAGNIPGGFCWRGYHCRTSLWLRAVRPTSIRSRRVFVTGLSAGGAMAAVMLATYPEVFAGGAIIAGLPYGCARSVQQAFDAMFTDQVHSANALGNRA